jgi:hypothetical protein
METKLILLHGDIQENFYQLGLKERDSFLRIEQRVSKLISTTKVLRQGQDILTKARLFLKKREQTQFELSIKAYSEGMGIDPLRFQSFLALFELAAHSGQIYPELKALLPGCTTLFRKTEEGLTHTRLLDFPLIGLFETSPRLYFWQQQDKIPVLSYSCEGLAPLMFQAVHGSGFSFALHSKPATTYYQDGVSIFELIFEALFNSKDAVEFRRESRKRQSITKWGVYQLTSEGDAYALDLDGPSVVQEKFNLNDSGPIIFTNIPLQKESSPEIESYLRFSQERQTWLKEKLSKPSNQHMLDLMTDIEDQRSKGWIHPCATLSTVGAYEVNLTQGYIDIKEGEAALTASDKIVRFSLEKEGPPVEIKTAQTPSAMELSWKHASRGQCFFDSGEFEAAYHELQMAHALMPHTHWKTIFKFYLCLWDFRFITNQRELALIYKELKALRMPDSLKDQWLLLCMRFERRLNLLVTVKIDDLSPTYRALYEKEKNAPAPLFATWMKLLYPRIEILEVFAPHHK